MDLWLVGYAAWPAPTRASKLVEHLQRRGVTHLVDIRLSPCASDPTPGRPYGPKLWNLQAGSAGIVGLLAAAGIEYTWIVELGNPQRQDHAMTVLRDHLADPTRDWPVHRGLQRLASMLSDGDGGATHALLCACGDSRTCHRTVVAHALNARHFAGGLTLREVVARRIPGDGKARGC
jgi:hypothetical protein